MIKPTYLTTAIASALVAVTAPSFAMNIGEAKVLSYTDQPLRVLIPIKAQPREWRTVWVSAQTYQRGLGLKATLFKPTGEQTDGYIEIKSQRVITDPIVELQITFETGHKTTVHRAPILIDVNEQTVKVQPPVQLPHSKPGVSVALTPAKSFVATNPTSTVTPASVTRPAGVLPTTKRPAAPNTPVTSSSIIPTTLPELTSAPPQVPTHIRASQYTPPADFTHSSVRASDGNIPQPPSIVGAASRRVVSTGPTGIRPPAQGGSGILEFNIKRGDTLYNLIRHHKPRNWTIYQALEHVFDTNRHAFTGRQYDYRTLQAGRKIVVDWSSPSPVTLSEPAVVPAGTPVSKVERNPMIPVATNSTRLPSPPALPTTTKTTAKNIVAVGGTTMPIVMPPSTQSPSVKTKSDATSPPSNSMQNVSNNASASSWTEADARAAVLRHRIEKLQQELNALQLRN